MKIATVTYRFENGFIVTFRKPSKKWTASTRTPEGEGWIYEEIGAPSQDWARTLVRRIKNRKPATTE